MKIVVKEPGQRARIIEGENKLETFQNIVGGYIECFYLVHDIVIVLNEEGKLMGLEPNLFLNNNELIVGPIAFVGEDNFEFTELNEYQIQVLKNYDLL